MKLLGIVDQQKHFYIQFGHILLDSEVHLLILRIYGEKKCFVDFDTMFMVFFGAFYDEIKWQNCNQTKQYFQEIF